ncbi:uncharacterized protein LOC110720795 [Chenopodium quinoa]|uniref:uncharacterized protein LOC110720795 n=1 Tax=Chenopodium quinoa TaxID=63459 RepID=UPI000B7730BD|nr:uncharacterized protein LOC110720795 [Chenopodium quinoa]
MKPRVNTCEDIDIEPKTGAPFFHIILTKTHVCPRYLLVWFFFFFLSLQYQTIPAEGARILPDIEVPKQFVVDNKLKVGDICTFELMSKYPMRLKVQVLRGDFSAALLKSGEEEDKELWKKEQVAIVVGNQILLNDKLVTPIENDLFLQVSDIYCDGLCEEQVVI